MNEQQWLASDDPAAMLALFAPGRRTAQFAGATGEVRAPSERQLRLLREAWESPLCGGERYCLGAWTDNTPLNDCLATLANVTAPCRAAAAALLRDVVGNPFRAAALPPCDYCEGTGRLPAGWPPAYWDDCPRCGGTGHALATPAVLTLARAAYEGAACGRCKGAKCITRRVSDPLDGKGRHTLTEDCPACHGTGRDESGALDSLTLKALADALDEAGCTGETCGQCGGYGRCRYPDMEDEEPDERCWGCGGAGRLPHPLLEHLRGPGPHVRGCFAVDLILGRSDPWARPPN
jgi:hypothetical protein